MAKSALTESIRAGIIEVLCPERGIDYWTEMDKQEIIQEVINSLSSGDEVSY